MTDWLPLALSLIGAGLNLVALLVVRNYRRHLETGTVARADSPLPMVRALTVAGFAFIAVAMVLVAIP